MPPSPDPVHDVVIVGGGPAGLTAAVYLARYHLKPLVIDAGDSRAASIPLSRNIAGFPAGIAGDGLLRRMRDHARRFGTTLVSGRVAEVHRADGGFRISGDLDGTAPLMARRLLLATGVRNHQPRMREADHAAALADGRLRYCPICDGYEATDQRIAVLGTGRHALGEALFLRSYSASVTLIAPDGLHQLKAADRARLASAGVALLDGPVADLELVDGGIEVASPEGRFCFDTLYPALGSTATSGLASALGAGMADSGTIIVDRHQRTDVPGLYAAGDVVLGLDQISHAIGAGGIAATTIRNDLAAAAPLLR